MLEQPGRDVYIVGNMASGKTTLARLLGESVPGSVYVPEPVEKNPFLPLYMRDQARWGMACMARYFLDYLAEWSAVTHTGAYRYHFVDAGTPTNRLLYGRYLQAETVISADEYKLYADLCDAAARAAGAPPAHAFVYLQATPETCLGRLRARGWGFQVSAVELTYLARLHHYLDEMSETLQAQGYPVLALSSEATDFTSLDGQATAVEQVARFLGSCRTAPAFSREPPDASVSG